MWNFGFYKIDNSKCKHILWTIFFETIFQHTQKHGINFIINQIGIDKSSKKFGSNHQLFFRVGMMVREFRAEEGDVTGKLLLILLFWRVLQFFHTLDSLGNCNLLFIDPVYLSFCFTFNFIWNLIVCNLGKILTAFFKYPF